MTVMLNLCMDAYSFNPKLKCVLPKGHSEANHLAFLDGKSYVWGTYFPGEQMPEPEPKPMPEVPRKIDGPKQAQPGMILESRKRFRVAPEKRYLSDRYSLREQSDIEWWVVEELTPEQVARGERRESIAYALYLKDHPGVQRKAWPHVLTEYTRKYYEYADAVLEMEEL